MLNFFYFNQVAYLADHTSNGIAIFLFNRSAQLTKTQGLHSKLLSFRTIDCAFNLCNTYF